MFQQHKHEAEKLIALDTFNLDESTLNLAEAQVQATLHAAEQQHISNLIALYNTDILSESSREVLAEKIKRLLVDWEE